MPSLVLPARPLSLARDVISTPRAYFWSAPVILALAVFLIIWEAPGVLRDFQISQNPVFLEDGDVRDGRCTTRRMIFTDCEARLVYSYNGRKYDTEVEVMFVDFHMGDYETGLAISADHPELATITLGLDKLWNRIITLTLFSLLLGGMGLGMVFFALRISRVKGQLRRPAPLKPIPVEITAFDRKRNILSITYNDKLAADKTGRSAYTRMTQGEEPLIVGEANGKAVGLAVRHGNTALPVLLDDRLQRVALSDEERAAALAPFHQHGSGQDRAVLVEAPRKTMSIWRRLQLFFGTLLLIVVGVIGFWLWYVTSSDTQFQSPGMDINNLMPKPLNEWGCGQLKKRFGQERAPFGCVAGDYTSWK
ncbi:membrane protein YdbS with pleckstrin-like domain [Neorhizobium sp. 2083]|uniref:hypothetical protein n=1 Tax=Neorhizobium sp. 2083 TaxID=2817762 RepID=UPI0028555589|nr:hypothetical protein [Neorhizobium sp. 2083]MDR6817728.1 membrane protein YdbS with pleckstrin-like domain [Neorhizobium sp. 2083]